MGAKPWEVSDAFWARAEPLIPAPAQEEGRPHRRTPGAGMRKKPARLVFEAIVFVLRTVRQQKALLEDG